MKNAITYYYNIVFEDIHQTGDMFYFDLGKSRYFFLEFNGEVETLPEIYELQSELVKRNIYIHQIVLNKDNQILTFISGAPYILLQTVFYDEKVTLGKILTFNNLYFKRKNEIILKELWAEKNDHLAYQISGIKYRYKIINESFDFFLGLAETSIQLLNEMPKENYPTVIAHKRIRASDTTLEFYNPLNLTIDSRIRDIAEYFKAKFFSNENINDELYTFLNKARLMTSEYYLFLARMLYPTYYFDLYEDIIRGKSQEEDIKKIIKKIDDYMIILKQIYYNYRHKLNFPTIEWLETI